MDAQRLKKYQQWLYSRTPLIAERRWRKASQALVRWRQRFDIGLGERPQQMEVGEFDIEIEG